MIESIKGSGGVSGISQSRPAPESKKPESTKADKKDEVVISKEAISLQQAEKTAADTNRILSNSAFSLGLGPDFASGNSN
jgi:hypothetical protein